VAFSPDGSKVASRAAEGTERIWALDRDDNCEVVFLNLSPDDLQAIRPLT
jgi:hypothetical protein